MHPTIMLARQSIKTFLETGQILPVPADIPQPMVEEEVAVFVTLHAADGQLRGCRGTISPSEPNMAEAIIKTAVASATDDPRFLPVTPDEVDGLQIKVDVLSPLEPVSDTSALDEKVYGVLIQSGRRRAVLLPDIAVVDSVARQLQLVRQKAGLSPDEPADLYRFTVTRYHANSDALDWT